MHIDKQALRLQDHAISRRQTSVIPVGQKKAFHTIAIEKHYILLKFACCIWMHKLIELIVKL